MATSTMRLRRDAVVVVMAAMLLLSLQVQGEELKDSSLQVVGTTESITTAVTSAEAPSATVEPTVLSLADFDNTTIFDNATGMTFDEVDDDTLNFAGDERYDPESLYADEDIIGDLPDGDTDVSAYDDREEPIEIADADQDIVQPYAGNDTPPAAPPGYDIVEDDGDNSTDAGGLSLASSGGGGGCGTGNMIDDCWRCDANWASHRQNLAKCAAGFGKCAMGGFNGPIYVVTSPLDDDPANPAPGTLRWAVTRPGPLWITFKSSMTIKLKLELMVTSYKTIDARGATVRIVGGAGLTLQRVSNVIIHGLYIHDVKPTGPGKIMTSTAHVGTRGRCDGDAISVFASKCVWIDHCYFARGQDGLVDVIRGSTAVTISNSFFTQHDKVILLGAKNTDYMDKDMTVTIMLNMFGPGLVQRMPRVRFGSCHIVNNDYTSGWGIYAIGGSEAPVLNCEGNLFQPGKGPKGVAKKVYDGGAMYGGPDKWPWKATGNAYLNGAYFQTSGPQPGAQIYSKATSCTARPVYMVESMTRSAGPLLNCQPGRRC